MSNPWLAIPEADYVGHMTSPLVGQRPVLARLLGDVLERVRPRRVLVLGASTGNGLEHVDPRVTSHVTVVDLNPAYLRRLTARFPHPELRLDVRCADLADVTFEPEAFDLVHAGLVLEYVDWRRVLPGIGRALGSAGVMSIVLQLQSAASPAVTPTEFTSLRALEALFRFVDPDALVQAARAQRLELEERRTEPLPGRKAFEVLRLVKRAR